MFSGIRAEIEQRERYINALISTLSADSINTALDVSVSLKDNVLKGLFFVQLYGLLEHTISSSLTIVINVINNSSSPIANIRPRLWSLHFMPECNAIRDGKAKLWEHQHKLFYKLEENEIFKAEDTLSPLPQGNIKGKHISFLWELLGIEEPVFRDSSVIGYLQTLADNRMAVAHGRMSSYDIGRNYTNNEIRNIKEKIITYCYDLVLALERYISEEKYLLS